MTTPDLGPVARPFAEAIAFLGERQPQPREVYELLGNDARLRAISIAGLAKMSALREVRELAIKMGRDGLTMAEFNDSLAGIIEENGGTLLPRARLDLIFRNMNAFASSAGRYRQIMESGIADDRPFGQYPLGPDDSHTTPVCRRLQGLVFPLRSPLAKRIWPPNHHAERHLGVTTMTEAQAKASGRLYAGSPDDEYPFLEDPAMGQGARVMPDPGFDFDPSSLLSADGGNLASKTERVGAHVTAKTASDYSLAPLSDASNKDLPNEPKLRGLRGDGPKGEGLVWRTFRAALGFAGEQTTAIVADFIGESVTITRESFDRILGQHGADASWFPLIEPAIAAPFEAWLVPFEDEAGAVRFVRRYIGLFAKPGQRKSAVVVDRSPEGWLMGARVYSSSELPEGERAGLLTMSKSKKKPK